MMKDLSNRLFFCYSWNDINEVQKIAAAIMHELSVTLNFYKGDENTDDIENQVFPLIEQADVILVFISDNSKQSSFVKQCAVQSNRLNKRVLPVLIGKNSLFSLTPEEFKFRTKTIEYKDEDQRSKFFGQLKATFGISVEGGDTFGTLVHISSDAEAKVSRYGKELCITKGGQDSCIRLAKGMHKLDFVSCSNSDLSISVSYEVKNNDGEQFLVVSFKKEREKLEKKKQDEIKKDRRKKLLGNLFTTLFIVLIVCGVIYLLLNLDKKKSSQKVEKTEEPILAVEEPVVYEQQIDSQIVSFITDMYNESRFFDNSFLEAHCTQRLLRKLAEEYPYDTEEVAYASWLFRTGAQEGKIVDGEFSTTGSYVVSVTPQGDGWYLYEFYDDGWLGRNQVHATIKDDVVWFDDLQKIYSEVDDFVSAEAEESKAAIKAFHTTDGIHLLKGTILLNNVEGYNCEQVQIYFIQENEKILKCRYINTGVWDENRNEQLDLDGIWFDNGYRFYNDEITIDLALRDYELNGHVKRNGESLEIQVQPFAVDEANEHQPSDSAEGKMYEYKGNIGPYPISMHLSYLAESGYYTYDKGNPNVFTLKPETVDANSIDGPGDCNVVLFEYTPKGFHSGTFTGTINYKNGTFCGTFINSKDESFDFFLEVIR